MFITFSFYILFQVATESMRDVEVSFLACNTNLICIVSFQIISDSVLTTWLK